MNQPLPGQGTRFLRDESAAGAGDAARTSLPADNLPLPPQTQAAERIKALQVQRQRINEAIKVLNAGDRAKISSGRIRDVMSVAERYAADSPQRSALMEVIEPRLAGLPEVNQKFIRASLETLPTKAERLAATNAQRASQAARGRAAVEAIGGEGSTIEKAVSGLKAMGGKQVQRFIPIGNQFSDREVADLMGQIEGAFAAKKIGWFDFPNATSALNLLLTGERLPGVKSEGAKALNLAPNEIQLLGRIFGPEFEQAIPKSAAHLSNWEKFFDVLNLPRAIVTAMDFSAAGRQGIVLAARNPVEWTKSLAPMIRSMASDEGFQKVGHNILSNPMYQDGAIHGLQITDVGGGTQAEEAFISHLVQQLPWWGGGGIIRGSERGYVAFLDNLRMLTYEKYANRLEKYATNKGWDLARTDAVKTQVASFLNHATGRGDLAGLERFMPALNAIFFAPKYFASRPESVWDMVRPGADKFTRQVAFENLGAFVGTGTAMLATMKATGLADVELDPRSADFGRMKIGPTRIDFWGGYQPIARYIAQIASGHTKGTSTGELKFTNPGETATRFFRSKLSPAGATVYDYLPGKQTDYAGNNLFINPRDMGFDKETGGVAWNAFATKILPLSIQDAINGYKTQGIFGALAAGAVSSAGGGVSSYEPTEKQQQTIAKQPVLKALEDAGFDSNYIYKQQYGQDALKAQIGGDPSQYDSLSAYRAAYVAEVEKVLEKQGMTSGRAHQTAGERFDAAPIVKEISKANSEYRMNFYKLHPDLAQQAADTGQESFTPNQRKELGIK